MKALDFSKNGGLRFTQDILGYMQTGYLEAILAIGRSFGDKLILSGCNVVGGIVTDGWLLVDGEPIEFVSSTLDTKVVLNEATQNVIFKNGLAQPIIKQVTATCSPVGNFDFSLLKRLDSLITTQQNLATLTAAFNAYKSTVFLTGDIKEVDCTMAYVLANFDSTGLGINERTGWAVCNGNNGTRNRQGRTSIGLQFPAITANPNDNVWDILYNTIGATVGKNAHQLSVQELAEHDHPIETGGDTYMDDIGGGYIKGRQNPDNRVENNKKTQKAGGNQPHENRQPSIVTLIIQKL
jgi:hypothetical protein